MVASIPPGFYDDETLKALESAYREVCATLTKDPRWESNNQELRVDVVQRLLNLVGEGVTHVEDLRTLALSHFTLSRI